MQDGADLTNVARLGGELFVSEESGQCNWRYLQEDVAPFGYSLEKQGLITVYLLRGSLLCTYVVVTLSHLMFIFTASLGFGLRTDSGPVWDFQSIANIQDRRDLT